MWFDRRGNPIGPEDWEQLKLHVPEYFRIAETMIGDIRISTVWIGIDMGFHRDGPPIIFETMVFGGSLDQECWRYATEAQAVEGHGFVVGLVRADVEVESK